MDTSNLAVVVFTIVYQLNLRTKERLSSIILGFWVSQVKHSPKRGLVWIAISVVGFDNFSALLSDPFS